MKGQPVRAVVVGAARVLEQAGIDSARVDAELLVAHALGVQRGKLPLAPPIDPETAEAVGALVARRANREPLQHIIGTAAMGVVDLAVGPGVFVPRPETELLLEWGLKATAGKPAPLVVDLCTGSGALALSYAAARPDATVHAVERDPAALAWARRNADARAAAGDTPVHLLAADVTDPGLLPELDGRVDLVLCNPPYVPEGTGVPPEVADHDPHHAVFSGADGLDVIRPVVALAARLLTPGGAVVIEHDDTHATAVPALLAANPALRDAQGHLDLAGRPRFATALRA